MVAPEPLRAAQVWCVVESALPRQAKAWQLVQALRDPQAAPVREAPSWQDPVRTAEPS